MTNGWSNRETWNVAMHLSQSESLYRFTVAYVKAAANPNYRELIHALGYEDSQTGDGVDWISDRLDYKSLDEMVVDLNND